MEPEQLIEQIRHKAHIEDRPLYGLVDGAQDLTLAILAREACGQEIRTLFQGKNAENLAYVAPYVFPIDPDSLYLQYWTEAIGENAGILLTSDAGFDAVHAHLRDIFIAQDEEDQEYFFRYYDPRVFRTYLPTCTNEEAAQFFGPVSSFLVEDEEGEGYLYYIDIPESGVITEPLSPKHAGSER
ncbi:MAG: DUF4123 domain-containing protein [Acidobacteriota bacterium]|nr:DUF4123 domain-containing protein [Acidobacteriota bacterium]